jgi:acetyltransferase-like isoleucine patch superfamily enzyme
VTALRRLLRLVRSVLDPRPWLHVARLVHFHNYDHVAPRRRASIGPGVALAPTVSLRNGERIAIGAGAHVGAGCSLWAGDSKGRISIGEHALFGPNVFVTASNYSTEAHGPVMHQPKDERDVTIGHDVWLGAGVTVLPGVDVGDGCVIGAGAVVTRSLPPGSIAVGSPARVVGSRGEAPLAASNGAGVAT